MNKVNKTGSLMFKAAVIRNLSLMVTLAVTFLTMPIIIKLLGDEWYGIWVVVGTFMGYFGVLDFGLTSATTRYLAKHWKGNDQAEIAKTITTSFTGFCILSCVALVLAGLSILLAPYFLDSEVSITNIQIVLLILALDLAIAFPVSVYQAVLMVEMRNDLIGTIKIVQSLIKVPLVYWLVSVDGNIIHVALMTFGLNLLMRFMIIWKALSYLDNKALQLKSFSWRALEKYFHFGKFTFLGQIGDLIRFRLDVVVIAGYLGSALVVPYEIALQLNRIASQAVSNVVSGSQPVFTNYYAEGRMDLVREKLLFLTRVNVFVSTILAASLLLVAQSLISIWVGDKYLSAYMPLIILCMLTPLGIGQNAAVQVFYAMSKHKYYAYVNLCEAGANLLISIMLVERYGLVGVALGTAIPFIISKCFFVPYYICKFTELSWVDYLKNFVYPLAYIAVFEVITLLLIDWMGLESFWLIFPLVSCAQVFIGVTYLKFVMPKSDFKYFADAVPVIGKVFGRAV